jgi:hypothetical protein
MSDTQDLIASIDERIVEARKEIASLEAALAAINTEAPAPKRSSPAAAQAAAPAREAPRRRARPGRASRRKASEVVPAGKLEMLLTAHDGLTTADLAEQANGGREQVLTLLRELEAAGRIRRTGERRSTRWHLITDEDRIAARVAELERQSRRVKAS